MGKLAIVQKLEKKQLKTDLASFRIGDTVRVHTRIVEGEKERVQVFTGTVVARKGEGASETFSVHRVAYGEGMERVFPLHSPRITKIEVIKEGHVRRSKLYYLRGTSGKASKVKARLRVRPISGEAQGAVTVNEIQSEEAASASSAE
ncbi:MAG: 50S ribosomal protein L19 [Parachlamydiaceae bacterium]